MNLSILTAHLPDRKSVMAILMRRLIPQVTDFVAQEPDWDKILGKLNQEQILRFNGLGVEWIIDSAAKNTPTGTKRNALIARATGAYTVFVDDDDLISEDYVSRVLEAIQHKPDVVGIEGRLVRRGVDIDKTFVHSLACMGWFEHESIYYRFPNHINPVKRELASAVQFQGVWSGEDKDWAQRLLPLLKTEVFLSGPIYQYNCR